MLFHLGNCSDYLTRVQCLEFDVENFNASILSWKKTSILAAIFAKCSYQRALHLAPWKANIYIDIAIVGKFRPQLIELTSFKPKLLIRFIRNKTCKNKQTSISCQNHAAEKINKTRYDDPGKPMKQTSFTIKNLGGNLPKKQSTIMKRSFRSSTKP